MAKRSIQLILVIGVLAFAATPSATAQSRLLSTAAGFHNPSYVAAHIQRSLNKQMILLDISGKMRCAGTKQVIVCIGDLTTSGLTTHDSFRYTYISTQRAKVVHRIETLDGSLLRKETSFVRPQRYGLSSF